MGECVRRGGDSEEGKEIDGSEFELSIYYFRSQKNKGDLYKMLSIFKQLNYD